MIRVLLVFAGLAMPAVLLAQQELSPDKREELAKGMVKVTRTKPPVCSATVRTKCVQEPKLNQLRRTTDPGSSDKPPPKPKS